MSRKFFKIRKWLVLGAAAGALGVTATAQARPILDVGVGGTGASSVQTQYWTAVDSFYKKQAGLNAGEQLVTPGRPVYLGPDGAPTTDVATQYWTAVDKFYKDAAGLSGLTPKARQYVEAIASLTPAQLVASFGTATSADSQSGPVATGSDGFNWADFGIGIGAALGAMLLAAALAQLARNRRRLATLH